MLFLVLYKLLGNNLFINCKSQRMFQLEMLTFIGFTVLLLFFLSFLRVPRRAFFSRRKPEKLSTPIKDPFVGEGAKSPRSPLAIVSLLMFCLFASSSCLP